VDAAKAVWSGLALIGVMFLVVAAFRKRGGGGGQTFGAGPGAYGTIYDLLNQDKRNAIELIVEDRAAERDEEHADDIPRDDTH
jgi:hypothetical protein